MKTKALIFAMLFLGCTAAAYAQNTKTPVARERQENQVKRIKQGRRSGELTKLETAKLAGQQANIQDTKRDAKADGTVTTRERAKIHNQQERASRNIARQKHDRQDRN
jgi:hypothetical protein